jgi:hypothetical protein
MSEEILSLNVIKQVYKVAKECIKLQGLIDEEMEDIVFMWCADKNYVNIITNIFRKQKRTREKNVEEEEEEEEEIEVKLKFNVIFKVDGSQCLYRLFLHF